MRSTKVEADAQRGNGTALGASDPAHDGAAFASAFAAFGRVGAALETAKEVDDVLRVIVHEVRALAGVERCSIHLRDEKAGLFRGCVGEGGERSMDYIKRSLAGMPADGMTLELLRTKRPVIITNARSDPRMIRSTARFWDIHSMMAVPMIFGNEVIGIIYLDDCERPHVFTSDDAEVASVFAQMAAVAVTHAQARIELRSKLDASERQIHALRRAAAVEERLSDLVLAGRCLKEIVETLAQVLAKPCAIYDADNNRLAVASPECAEGMQPRLLESPAVEDSAVVEALDDGGSDRPFLVSPLPDVGVMHRHLVAPIVVDDELWARLVVMEYRTRFVGGDMLTLRRAAMLVALHMRTERSAIEADWNAGASLAAEVLDGCSDASVVERRAERLGVQLDEPHAVALIGSREERDASVSDFRAVAAAFRELSPGLTVHATKVEAGVAVILHVPEGTDSEEFAASAKDLLGEVCERLGGTDRVAAGMSAVSSEPSSYSAQYLEAQQVLECIRRFGSEQGPAALSSADLGTGRIFLATSDAEAVRAFADGTFGELVGDPTKSDLLATLRCFFDNMASIRRCALELGVHENTIRYRLARIEELTGLCVTHDPDAQLGARLSLLVLMTQGRLAGQDAPGGAPGGQPRRESLKLVGALAV
jgi:GAF domain-containing protein/sugar diacid utilization regulator